MKRKSEYKCEQCAADVKQGTLVCVDCVADFYRLHSLWMAGLNQTKAPTAEEQGK